VTFLDGLQGAYCEELEKDCGDFILRRSDGVYAYQLAVVTDDALGAVTEVVRGCDLLSSTPRQLYLGRLLGFPAPRYYHVPILTAPDGRRLSKRDADLSLGALRQRMTPQAVIGALAFAAGLLPQNTPVFRARACAGVFLAEGSAQANPVRSGFFSLMPNQCSALCCAASLQAQKTPL
jgi:glutamyl-tRNA synthetase